jgi:asparaginyl-tRNA synthetase
VEAASFDEILLKDISTGACIGVTGKLVESQGQGQKIEINASAIELYGKSDAETYPLQKKGHSMEFLREIAISVQNKYIRRCFQNTSCHGICDS